MIDFISEYVVKNVFIFLQYVLSERLSFLSVSLTVVSLSTALMGIIKRSKLISCINSKVLQNVLFSWISVLITMVLTIGCTLLNHLAVQHIVGCCIFNSLAMVFTYWFCKSTAIRDGLLFLGNKIISKFRSKNPKSPSEVRKVTKDVISEVESLLNPVKSTTESYSEDDLKNL